MKNMTHSPGVPEPGCASESSHLLEPLGTCSYTELIPGLYGLDVCEESSHDLGVCPHICLGAYAIGAGGEEQPVHIYFKTPPV